MTTLNQPCELILTHDAFQQAVRPLLLDPGRCAVGPIRWNSEPAAREMLVPRLDLADRPPTGAERLPLADWLVLAVDHPESPCEPQLLLERIKPRQSQVVALLILSRRGVGWQGMVYDQGQIIPLEAFRIVGPRMFSLRRAAPAEPLEAAARLRWSRTIGALGEPLWRKLHAAHVVLIGCGRNGCQMAWQLAALGVGRLTLIDADLLLLENLDAMPGLSHADLGKPKVEALGARLVGFRPDVSVRCLAQPVHDVLDRLRVRADLIVTCVDDDFPRLTAAWLARETLTPHLDVGTAVTQRAGLRQHPGSPIAPELTGDIRLLVPYSGCVLCAGGLAEPEECLYEFAAPPGSLYRGVPAVWSEQRAGSLVTLNGLAVSSAVQLWLEFLAGTISGSWWQRLRWSGGAGVECSGAAVAAGDDCRLCRL